MQVLTRFAIMDPQTNKYLLPRDCSLPQVFNDDVRHMAQFEDREAAAALAGLHVQNAKRINDLYPHMKPMPTRLVLVPVQIVIEEPVEEVVAV